MRILNEFQHLREIGYSDTVIEERMRESFDLFDIDTVFITEEEAQDREYDYLQEYKCELTRKLEDYLLFTFMKQLSTYDREQICLWVENQ